MRHLLQGGEGSEPLQVLQVQGVRLLLRDEGHLREQKADDDRLFALISFYPRFPFRFERICTITLDNARGAVEEQLRLIARADTGLL